MGESKKFPKFLKVNKDGTQWTVCKFDLHKIVPVYQWKFTFSEI